MTSKILLAQSFLSEDFNDTLSKTYNGNPEILEQRNKLFQIDELMPQAYSSFRPKIGGFYEKGKVDIAISGSNFISDGVRTETSKGIKITQPIFEGGANISKIREAENKIYSQRYLVKSTEQKVLLEASKIYSKFTSQKTKLKLSNKNVEFLKKQFESTNSQFEIGNLTFTDVSISKSRLLLAESDLIKSKSDLMAFRQEYVSVVGDEPKNPSLFFNFPKFKYDLEELVKYSLNNNPEIRSLKYQLKSLEKKIRGLYQLKLPKINLQAELRKDSGYFKSDSSREVMSAYANIDIPLYQSGNAASKIREAKKEHSALKELLKSRKNLLKSKIVRSWSIYKTSLSKIDAYQEQVKANTKFLEGLNQELFLGERTILEILDGEQELIKSELSLVQSNQEYFDSYFEILCHMGNMNPEFLKLTVQIFDDTENFNNIRYKWLDLIE